MYNLEFLELKLGGVVKGNSSLEITKIATLSQAGKGDISFCTNPKHLKNFPKQKLLLYL